MKRKTVCALLTAGLFAALAAPAEELFYSNTGPGYYSWDVVDAWIIYNTGNTPYGQLPTSNDNVRINATAPKAENGNALTVTNGVFAECAMFAAGDQNYDGTAWFRLDGGSLTCNTHFVIGRYYPGLATLESGTLYGKGEFYIGSQPGSSGTVTNNGATVNCNNFIWANYAATPAALVQNGGSMTGRVDVTIGNSGEAAATFNGGVLSIGRTCYVGRATGSYGALVLNDGLVSGRTSVLFGHSGQALAVLNGGALDVVGDLRIGNASGGSGTVTNTGAAVSANNILIGYTASAAGRLVHTGGSLSAANQLQAGRQAGIGEFEADAPFTVKQMIIGTVAASGSSIPGTGTVTMAENALATVGEFLRVNNGGLLMRGGAIHLSNVGNPNRTNLFVRSYEDSRARIQGWGYIGYTNENITLRMLNNGQIVADGEGVERDLDLNMIAVVNTDIPNGPDGTNGWYAVNKGRLVYPRSMAVTFPAGTPTTVCSGDLHNKAVPELVNSLGVTMTYATAAIRAIRTVLCAPDRTDIPPGLPEHLVPVGVWRVGSFTQVKTPPFTAASFTECLPAFRYDWTKLTPKTSSLRLFRHNGTAWVQVGAAVPDSTRLIAADAPLAPLSGQDFNIGWFALMAVERNGTLISVQ
jgi:hypothetical protein